jgi:hypothetical protein
MTTQITTTNYLHTIDEALTACAAANSEYQSFDRQLAASLAWSLANRYQYFFSELMLVDHPKNPRRARSHEESIERTLRLEGICDETLGLLSVMAARTSAELLPEASRYFPATPGPGAGQRLRATSAAPGSGDREGPDAGLGTTVPAARDGAQAAQRCPRRTAPRGDHRPRGAGRAALADALTNCRGWDPDDLSPRLAVKVFEVFLGKLDQYTSRLYAEALNNPNDAVAEEAEAQFAILEDVRQRLGAVAYQARIDAETSRFEPAREAA